MAGKLFTFAVLYHPRAQKDTAGNSIVQQSEILVKPQQVIAADEEQVKVIASRAIPADKANDLDTLEIIVRPF